jgi:hypothetical protein
MRGQNSPARLLELTQHFSNTSAPRAELKSLVPEDAQQAIGHGVRAKRFKSGAITFELLDAEDSHATV